MKSLLTIPAVFLATASFVSFSLVFGPALKKLKKHQQDRLKKYQQSYYFSRR